MAMSRRRFLLIFNVLAISLILVTGFVVYSNREHISWLKGQFGKAAVSQTYTVTESAQGNHAIIGVSITCSATSDVNASGFIVGWNVTISGSNLDVAKISTDVKIHVPWYTSIIGTNQVTGSQYYPGAQPPVVVASAETAQQPGYGGSLVQCNLSIPEDDPPPPPTPTDREPIGNFDAITCESIIGWALDQDELSRSLDVHIYRDGQPGSGGVFLGSYPTNILRADVNQAYGATGNHGFVIPTPESLRDGQSHQVFIYAINPVSGKNNPLITGSPKTLACPLPPPPPLVCNPNTQTVAINATATFTASGGTNSYVWSAPGATTPSGVSGTFFTTYATSGNKTVTVTSGSQTATCAVTVRAPIPELTCSPGTQTVITTQPANFAASGGTGVYSWSAPGALTLSGGGNTFTTSYAASGNKTVTVTSGGKQATCAVVVVSPPPPPAQTVDIEVLKTVDKSCVTVGEDALFTVTVTNKGPIAASSVEINDFWSGLLSYQSSSVSKGTWDGSLSRWTIGALSVGESATLVLAMNVYGAGNWTNTASLYHSVPADVTQANNSSTARVCGVAGPPPPAQLSCATITPSVNVNEVAIFSANGGTGTYTWSAPGSATLSGSGTIFSTRYTTGGTKTVTVTSGSQQVNCTVVVTQIVPHNPVGNFDIISCEGLEGWAYDPDVAATSIDVHVYDGQAGNGGVLLGAYPTTIDRPDVNQTFSITGAHGFRVVPLPAALLDGQLHAVYIYAIDRTGGSNTLLASSPKSIQCATALKLTCAPQTQTVVAGQPASFTAVGGTDPISWFADFGSSPSSGTGRTFSTSYTSPGSKTVTVTSGQQQATCTLVVTPAPPAGVCKLEINKTVDKATAEPGDELTYSLVLKNTGTAACGGVTGVKVQDQYDANIVYVRETHPSSVVRGYAGDGSPFHDLINRVLTWNANLLQPGQSVSIQWVGQIKDLTACATATVVNTAKATADEYNHLQSFVTSAQVTTSVTAACPSQLVCAPATQQVTINKPATFSATGGSGTLTWQATGGTPSAGSGASFVTQYSQAGSKQVIVRAGSAQSTCAVIVVDDSTPPSPLVCSPATQTVALNQQAIMVVSGATGTTTWSAPGATVTAGTGSTFSTAYNSNGTKTVTVTAANGSAACSVVVTGTPPAQTVDLAVQKSVAPSLIQVGQNAVFTISVTNNGPVDATGVALVDTLPAGVTIVDQVATQGNFNADTRVWTVGALAVSGVAELRITVSGDSVGSKLNTVLLTASTPTDTNTSNNQAQATLTVVAGTVVPEVVCAPSFQSVRVNQQALLAAAGGTGNYNWTAPEATPNTGTGNSFSAYYTSVGSRTVTLTSGTKQTTCTVNVIPEPVPTPQLDLAVTKQVAPALIQAGETSTFTIVVTNQSSVQGNSIQYKDIIPSGLAVSSASASQGTFTSSTGVWDVGALGVNQSATLTIQVVGPQAGTYTNQVSLVTVTPQDTNSANNTASATLVVQSQPGGGNPSLICASGVNTILVGQDVKFYANNASGLYSWSVPSGTPSAGSGSIFTTRFSQVGTQTATVTSGNQSATCTVIVYAPTVLTSTDTTADLSLTKIANPSQVLVGQETIFTITLHNAGPGSPDLVSVKDQLPQGLSVLRAVASQGTYDPVTGIWAVGRMQAGQEVILLITAQADKVGVLTNTSEVWTSSLPDVDSTPGNSHASEDDQASATVTVGGTLPQSGSPTIPIIFFALVCIIAAASAVQIRTIRIARLQTPLGEVEVPLDSL